MPLPCRLLWAALSSCRRCGAALSAAELAAGDTGATAGYCDACVSRAFAEGSEPVERNPDEDP